MNPDLSDGAKAFLEAGIRGGGVVSDGPVRPGFDRGWALHPFVGERAHYWRANGATMGAAAWLSDCGLRCLTTERVPLLGAGSHPLCARCDAALLRRNGPAMTNRRSEHGHRVD